MAPPDHLRRGEGVKCCSETQVLQPARQTRATFPSQNKTIFAVGSVATKALHRVSLSPPPPPPLATDGEDGTAIAEGLRQQERRMGAMRAADGRAPHSPNPVSARQSLHAVLSAAISRRVKGKEARCRIHARRCSQPRPSVTKASLLQHWRAVGTQMQPQSARWACSHHMAAMTKAAKALQVLREPLLNEFSREMRPCIQITSPLPLRSSRQLSKTEPRWNYDLL